MKIKCTKCNTEYNIDSSRIPAGGIKIKCPKCLNSFTIQQDGSIADLRSVTPPPPPPEEPKIKKEVSTPAHRISEKKPEPTIKPPLAPPPPPPAQKEGNRSSISIDNLPDLPDLPDLPEIGEDSTSDLLNTLDQEIATTNPTQQQVKTDERLKASDSATGLDFGMVNLDEAIASSLKTTPKESRPTPSPLNISESKKVAPEADSKASRSPPEPPAPPETASASKKFKVKRRSGKVFGPFDQDTIVRMLIEHKLLGNEDVSEDGVNWQGISKIPEFNQAIVSMLDNISQGSPPTPKVTTSISPEPVKTEHKRRVDVKKEGVKEPSRFEEFRDKVKGKFSELRAKFASLSVKVKISIISIFVVILISLLLLLGFKIYSQLFGGKLTPEQQKIVINAISNLYSGNFADISESVKTLKLMYPQLRYKTHVCSVLTRIFIYERSFLSLEKENEDLLTKCIRDIKKERIGTPESLFALGLYYVSMQDDKNLEEIMTSLNTSPHYQNYLNGLKNLFSKNLTQAIANLESYIQQSQQDSLTMEIIGEIYLSLSDLNRAQEWFKKATETNHKNRRALVEYNRLIFITEGDQKTPISTIQNLINTDSDRIHKIELARAEHILANMYAAIRKNEEADRYFKNSILHSDGRIEYRISYAEYLFTVEEIDRAFDEFNAVVKQDPTNINAKLGLVKVSIKQRKILNAHKTIMELYNQNPSHIEVLLYKGKVFEELEKFQEAEESYNQILSINKDSPKAKLALANLLIRQGKSEDGLNLLEDIKTKNPQDTDALIMLGETYLKLKKFDLATENLRHVIEVDNYNTYARYLLARAYIEKQEYEEALKHLEVVKLQISKIPELKYYFGRAYFGLKKYHEAITNLEAELKENRSFVEAMILLGKSYSMNSDHQKAIEILNNATIIDNSNALAYFELGMAYLRKGDKTSAIESLKQATNKSKENIEFRFLFGKTMIENNMFTEGLEELKKVVKREPDNPQYRYHLAMGYYLAKNYRAAITEFSKVYALDPTNESSLFFTGKSYQAKKDYQAAIRAFEECIAKNKENDKAYFELGRTYELRENYDQAISYYEKAIAINSSISQAYYRLGYIYKGKNNYKRAISFFEQFLKISPEDDLAQEVQDEIYDLKEAIKDSEEEERTQKEIQKKNRQEEEE